MPQYQREAAGAPRLDDDLVNRPRLLTRLDRPAPVRLLRAPIGFGKTTLVAQWIAGRDPGAEQVAWLRVRPGGGDPTAFWASLVDVLGDAGLSPPRSAHHRDPQALAERMITAADRPLLLVVDGFENVAGAGIDAALLDLVWHAPRLQLIICLRSHRPFADEQLLHRKPTVIDAHDLLFTGEETAQLFAAAGAELSPEDAALIHELSGGWPEPTRSFALRLARTGVPADLPAAAGAAAGEYLRRRLLPEVTQPERVEFALATSLPEAFSADLAELLSGTHSAKAQLEWLDGEGVLLAEIRDGEPVYQWPGAARRALTAELRRRDPHRLTELHSRLARWYLDHEQADRAIDHAVQAQDWTLLVDVIDTSWRTLLYHHREQLYAAVTTAPLPAIRSSRRAIAMRDVMLQVSADGLLSTDPLPKAPAALDDLARRDDAADTLDTAFAVLIAFKDCAPPEQARDYAVRIIRLARAARAVHPADIATLYPSVLLMAGITIMVSDEPLGAAEPLREAYGRASDSPYRYIARDAAGKLALIHALNGDSARVEEWLGEHDAAAPADTWLAAFERAVPYTSRLLLALDRLDLAAADEHSKKLRRHLHKDRLWGLHLYAGCLLALHNGTAADQLHYLDNATREVAEWIAPGTTGATLLAAAEADLLLSLGQAWSARTVLNRASDTHPFLRVSEARLALLTGQNDAALRLAGNPRWDKAATIRHRLEMLLIRALAAYRLGDHDIASHALRRAVGAAHTTGALRPFTTVPRAELSELAELVPGAAELLAAEPLAGHPDLFPSRLTLIRLTRREELVLDKLAAGLSLQQTADALVVSYNTIRTQQASIYRKLGVDTRADAIARARQWGLI